MKWRNTSIKGCIYNYGSGFTPSYSQYKLQDVTHATEFLFSLAKSVSKSLKKPPSGNDFK